MAGPAEGPYDRPPALQGGDLVHVRPRGAAALPGQARRDREPADEAQAAYYADHPEDFTALEDADAAGGWGG